MEKSPFEVTLPFGDESYKFRLDFKAVSGWEEQHGRSMFATFNEMVHTRTARLSDVRSILHIGLVGGGMIPTDATAMVKRFVEDRPLSETHPTALAVLEAFLFGNDEYRAGKEDADGTP